MSTTPKSNIEILNIFHEKNPFIIRQSYFTNHINKSLYKGFYILFQLGLAIRIFSYYGKTGYLFDERVWEATFQKGHYCLGYWTSAFLYSLGAYFIETYIRSKYVRIPLQVATLTMLLTVPIYLCWNYRLYIVQKGFIGIVSCIFFMKLYSYFRMNAIYRADADEKKNAQVTFSYYLSYIFMPVLVYQHTYPRVEKINRRYIVLKLIEFLLFFITLF